MKATKELRSLSSSELRTRADEFKKELLKLNVQVASGASTVSPGKIKLLKKNVARINTMLNQKEAKP